MSVLIGTYNHERFIARSIESALAQIYPADRMEVIVVDDASTDGTQEAVAPYLDRITYIRQSRNGGLISTVNTLYGAANGELIAMQSGDDISPLSRLAIQVEAFLRQPEVGLHYGDLVEIDADDNLLAPSHWRKHGIEPLRGRPTRQLLATNFVPGGTIMVRRSVLDSFLPIPKEAAYEDWWTAIHVSRVADLDYTLEPLSRYRLHDSNIHNGAEGERLIATLREAISLRRWLAAEAVCPEATGEEWLGALSRFLDQVQDLSQRSGLTLEDLVPTGSARELESMDALRSVGTAWALGESTQAIRHAVAAVAHSPRSVDAKAALTFLMARATAPVPTNWAARTFVTLADAEELLGDQSLLMAYAELFTDADDASLIVSVHPDAVEAFVALATSLGLGEPGAAHVVVEPAAGTFVEGSASWAPHVHMILTGRRETRSLPVHLHVDVEGVHGLRELAEQRLLTA